MSNKSSFRKHQEVAGENAAELVKMIRGMSGTRHTHEIFSDFIELAALSISNAIDKRQFDLREARYLDVVKKYKREEVQQFPQMLAMLVSEYDALMVGERPNQGAGRISRLRDVLGSMYMMFDLGNERTGQFFTPYEVSELMAQLVGPDTAEIEQRGFMRLNEPACGAGGMVVAYADVLMQKGVNYQTAMHAICVDVDIRCVHMAYLQLSLLHIPAIIVHGNSLSMEEWSHWYTPAHIMGGWSKKLSRRRDQERAERDSIAMLIDKLPVENSEKADVNSRIDSIPPTETKQHHAVIDFKKLEQMTLF